MKGKMQRQSDCQKLPLSEGSTMDMEREKNGKMPALNTGGFFHIIQLNSGKAELSVLPHFPSQKKDPKSLQVLKENVSWFPFTHTAFKLHCNSRYV